MQCRPDGNMEGLSTQNNHSPTVVQSHDVRNSESAENFQKFIYELFEKNGVINDLRAYLRGHIVGVLRSAETGDPPACQKHFTERLDLQFQALNMLVAEYLLRLKFSYSLSVFISEIPLANMVFAFAKSLMQGTRCDSSLRFKNEDVWSLLNYLGVKCDSQHASNIVEMYREEMKSPLLLCILKCMPMYAEPADSTQDNLSSSGQSSSSVMKAKSHHSPRDRCRHYVFCRTCQSNLKQVKEKYRHKKNSLTKNIRKSSAKNLDYVMSNIEVMEKSLINEMFHQLKSVYETEMAMIKSDEDKRLKRSLTTLAMQLQRKRAEMEEKLKAREAEAERSVQQRKRFLWGVARGLRAQQRRLARGAASLADKEVRLKSQLAAAELALRRRSEEAGELAGELAEVKRERDSIDKEREELEHAKHNHDNSKVPNSDTTKEDLRKHYDLLTEEFSILKKYLETVKLEPKCVVERSTITDLADLTSKIDVVLNNGQDMARNCREDKLKAKQVVNDLKKQKNVNFSQSKLDEIYRSRSHSSGSSEAGDAACDTELRLREENQRLRTFSTQQREHIDELSSQHARLRAELAAARLTCGAASLPCGAAPHALRPRTAPAVMPDMNLFMHYQTTAGGAAGRGGGRHGAGEEAGGACRATPRLQAPGGTLPFIGVLRDRHKEQRRYLINQWHSLRRRASPARGAEARAAAPPSRDGGNDKGSAGPSVQVPSEEDVNNNESSKADVQRHSTITACPNQSRPNSPRRDKSPNSVIRDAKLRLRKLEIEAEAVEQSYLDFRRKREALRGGRKKETDGKGGATAVEDLDLKSKKTTFKSDDTPTKESIRHINEETAPTTVFGRYIKEYHAKYNVSETQFKNKHATCYQNNPVPAAFSQLVTATAKERKNLNYLETPMAEFRKYYHSEKIVKERIKDPVTINLDKDSVAALTESRDNSDHVRSPTFININAFSRPQTPIAKPWVGGNTIAVSELETIKGIVDDKSPVTIYRDDPGNNNAPRITINTETIGNRDDPGSDKDMSLILANSDPIESKTNAKAPINRNLVDNDSKISPRTPKFTHSKKTEAVESPKKRPRSPKSPSRRSKDHGSPKKDRNHTKNSARIQIRSRPQSPNSDSENRHAKIEIFTPSKHDRAHDMHKVKELQILKENIGKMYNLSEKSVTENLNEHFIESVDVAWIEKERKSVDETITEVSRSGTSGEPSKEQLDDKNLLQIELQSVSAVKTTDSLSQDVVLVVESPNEDGNMDLDFRSTEMTILVSPKQSSIDQPDIDTNDNSIKLSEYYQNPKDITTSVPNLEQSTAGVARTASEFEAIEDRIDYADDFSADVDNFNSPRYGDTRSEDIRSPISLPKTSEDENFWDS